MRENASFTAGRLVQTAMEPLTREKPGIEMAAVDCESVRWSAD